MEGLRPERDELDRFNSRQAKQKKQKKQPVKQKEKASNKSGFVSVVAIVLLFVSVFLAWGFMTQQDIINSMKQQLEETSYFVNQSKLLMARFEGELNDADAEMAQSGSVVAQKLAFLDSEMRKLWGVSNDRNKKSIKENSEALASLKASLAAIKKEQVSAIKSIQLKQVAAEASASDIDEKVKGLQSIVQTTASEVALTRDIINEEIDLMKFAIESSEALEASISENKSAISSIDKSRLQLNARIVELESQLNQLRLELKSINAPKSTPDGVVQDVVVDVQ